MDSSASYTKSRISRTLIIIIAILLLSFTQSNSHKSVLAQTPGKVQIYFESTSVDSPATNLRIMINANGNNIAFVRVGINFDNSKLNLTNEIETNPDFGNIITKTSMTQANTEGNIIINCALSTSNSQPLTGTFLYANIPVQIMTEEKGTVIPLVLDSGKNDVISMLPERLPFDYRTKILIVNGDNTFIPIIRK